MAGLSISTILQIIGDYTNTAGLAAQDAHVSQRDEIAWTTGSSANQATKLYTSALNIAASGNTTLDLTALTDAQGAALTFASIKAIILIADAANVNNVVLGNAASNQFAAFFDAATDTVSIPPNGAFYIANPTAAGWTVDGTHKSLKLANSSSGSAVTGELYILGN